MGNYALMIVFTLSMALASYSGMTKRNLYQAQLEIAETYNRSNAKNIAQSVTSIVVNRFEDDQRFAVGTNSTTYYPAKDAYESWGAMNGSYNVELTNYGDSLISVDVIAKAGLQSYSQSAILINVPTGWNPNLNYGVFSKKEITLNGGARIKGHVATNSKGSNDVVLNGGARIDSNLYIAPGGLANSVVNNGNLVKGEILNMSSELEYSLPDFPEFPQNYRRTIPIYLTWFNRRMVLRASDYSEKYFPSINVRSNYNITFDTGSSDRVLYVENLNVTQGDIKVIGSGNLTIYVDGDFILNGSSTINANTGDSQRVMIYYKGSKDLSFGGATQFYGDIYIEQADLTVTGSGGVQGHVLTAGKNVTLNGAGNLNSTLLFAPNADVTLNGGAKLYGTVIADSFKASGGAIVDYSSGLSTPLPSFGDQAGQTFKTIRWY